MKIEKVIENIGTVLELKRLASAYVIDYRNLTEDEIREAFKKTAPQYYYVENIRKVLNDCLLSSNRNLRILSSLMVQKVLLQKDGFMCPKRETEDAIIAWEQGVVDRSNEDLFKKSTEKSRNVDFFTFVLDTAWQNNDEISPDEKNLIEKIRDRLKITDTEFRIIEAKLGKFPLPENRLHSRSDIDETRRHLQSAGILFALRDTDGTDYDIIPDEVAGAIREIEKIEIRDYGFRELLRHKYVRTKQYLTETLGKCGIEVDSYNTVERLQEDIMDHVPPSVVLGGLTPRDGLPVETLSKWCGELDLNVSGPKNELIDRIIKFYDKLLQRLDVKEDPREAPYHFFVDFAARNAATLRSQQLIEKDIEIERKFEDATKFLFETKLFHKPLTFVGQSHADGALSFRDEILYWDNKSKETPVNLKDHVKQFDGYIRTSEKKVAGFLVIGPSFTDESSVLSMQYQVENGTTLTLITAAELKSVAEKWEAKQKAAKTAEPFPLGYLIQQGRFNPALVPVL
jgi:hypothetical protein